VLGAPPREATHRPVGDRASVGDDETAVARERPASHDGASQPGAAPQCTLLCLECPRSSCLIPA
jgi:hypothetical protein